MKHLCIDCRYCILCDIAINNPSLTEAKSRTRLGPFGRVPDESISAVPSHIPYTSFTSAKTLQSPYPSIVIALPSVSYLVLATSSTVNGYNAKVLLESLNLV
jgi:hypothetical protein